MRFKFFLFLAILDSIAAYKAIVFTFHDSGSHQGSISKLFLKSDFRLASLGHEVHVFDTTSKTLPNYGENIKIIDGRTDFVPAVKYNVSQRVWTSFPDVTTVVRLYNVGDEFLKSVIEQKPELLSQILNEHYDIAIVGDIFSTHGIYFAETLKRTQSVPYLLYGTTLQFHAVNSARGFNRHLLSRPDVETNVKGQGKDAFNLESFWIRLEAFWSTFSEMVALRVAVNHVVPTLNTMGLPNWDFVNFYQKGAYFLSEAFDRLGFPLAEASDFKGVGPYCPSIGTLPKDIELFVNDPSSKGTIFAALGSHAKWNVAPEYIIEAFFTAFEKLSDYRIIFSYNGTPKKVSKHIMLLNWSPQKEILNHPKTKVFISHSGLKSLTEAICAAVPVIFMPLYAEQRANSQFMAYFGYSRTLDKFTLKAEDIVEAVYSIEANFPERKQKMFKLKNIFLDRIINPMDEAVFYVNRVVQSRNGTSRMPFEKASLSLNWFVFFCGDLILVIICCVLVLF